MANIAKIKNTLFISTSTECSYFLCISSSSTCILNTLFEKFIDSSMVTLLLILFFADFPN